MNTAQLTLIVSTFSFAMGILLDWIITTHGKNHQGKWSRRILAVLLAVSFGANFANAQNITKLHAENENLQNTVVSLENKSANQDIKIHVLESYKRKLSALESSISSEPSSSSGHNLEKLKEIANQPVYPPMVSHTVYITDTGTKYHRSGCQYLRKSKYAIDLGDAKKQGYGPCSKCNPPR
ncbi:hypothetical protein CE91St46_15240 [Eubacteriales bacterium]|nr:hypothetical protein [Faecalicatena sp. BF-R-105]GKH50413.1 hypothetical protein CE91St46_15240 [Eubacteriales bacterium]GKH63136.1 hypothetical protein CE91St47_16050 [Eubacteriales bacterium]